MSMRITLELSETDLNHFRKIMRKAIQSHKDTDSKLITDAALKVLDEVKGNKVPDFISERLGKLKLLVDMVHDTGWALPEKERKNVIGALAYFSDPQDLIPDEIPGLGFLDDAIMIELVVRALKHEIEAYVDFCDYRDAETTRHKLSREEADRAEWLVDRRKQLQSRMRRRRGSRRRSAVKDSPKMGSSFSLFG